MGDLSKNFSREEFECQCGDCGLDTVDAKLLEALQMIRDKTGKPISIESGMRCVAHNKRIGGAPNSYHVQGKAADIKIEGLTPTEVAEIAAETGIIKGIGVYSSWVHVDVRDYVARWGKKS